MKLDNSHRICYEAKSYSCWAESDQHHGGYYHAEFERFYTVSEKKPKLKVFAMDDITLIIAYSDTIFRVYL